MIIEVIAERRATKAAELREPAPIIFAGVI